MRHIHQERNSALSREEEAPQRAALCVPPCACAPSIRPARERVQPLRATLWRLELGGAGSPRAAVNQRSDGGGRAQKGRDRAEHLLALGFESPEWEKFNCSAIKLRPLQLLIAN